MRKVVKMLALPDIIYSKYGYSRLHDKLIYRAFLSVGKRWAAVYQSTC